MHLSAIDMITQYRDHANQADREIAEELLELINTHPDCFERKPEEGAKHIAATVLVLSENLETALFMWHAKIKCWTQPGGHADGESNLYTVARKELAEETGITQAEFVTPLPLDIYRFDYPSEVFGYTKSIYNVTFAMTIKDGQVPNIMEPAKCLALRWATPDEAKMMLQETPDVRTLTLIEKWEKLRDGLKNK